MPKLLSSVLVAFAAAALLSTPGEAATGGAMRRGMGVQGGASLNMGGGAMIGFDGDVPAGAEVGGRSFLQVCRKDIAALCGDERRGAHKCLAEKAAQITDGTCKAWVGARDTCVRAARKSGKCAAEDSGRACLQRAAEADLPAACTASDFYKRATLAKRRRAAADAKKAKKQ